MLKHLVILIVLSLTLTGCRYTQRNCGHHGLVETHTVESTKKIKEVLTQDEVKSKKSKTKGKHKSRHHHKKAHNKVEPIPSKPLVNA